MGVLAVASAWLTVSALNRLGAAPESLGPRIVELQVFLGICAVAALIVATLSAQRHHVTERLQELNDTLERRIQDRTASLQESERRSLALEEAAREAAAQLSQTLDTAAVGLVRVNRDFVHVSANPAYAALAGLPVGAIVGRHMVDVIGASAFAAIRPFLDRVLAGETVEYETLLPFAHAPAAHIHVVHTPWRDTRGQVTGWVGSVTNITQRKYVEERLRASREHLSVAMQASQSLSFEWDIPNDRVRHLHSADASLPMTEVGSFDDALMAVHPDDRAMVRAKAEAALTSTDGEYAAEFRVLRPDGQVAWKSESGRVEFDAEDRPLRLIGIRRDVTAQKAAEEQQRYSEELHRISFDHSPTGIVHVSLDARFIRVNQAMCEITGYAADELRGKSIADLTHPDDAARDAELLDAYVRGDTSFYENDKRYVRKDGSIRWVSISARMVRDAAGNPLHSVGSVRDITERVRALGLLRESEQRFRVMADGLPLAVWVHDANGTQEFVNGTFCRFFGLTPEDLQRDRWQTLIHPEDEAEYVGRFRECVRERRPFHARARVRVADGSWRWVECWGQPRIDDDGTFLGMVGATADITEQRTSEEELRAHRENLELLIEKRTAELEASHRRLRLSERMASLGTLAAGLGHDMGNLLIPLGVRLDSLEGHDLSDAAKDDVRAIRTSAEYLQKLANGLRLLALDPERSPVGEATELASWWSDAKGVLKNVLPIGVALDSDFTTGACTIAMSKAALTQVIFNLVQNAGDAMKAQRSGHVRVRAQIEGSRVRIEVSDDGPGMTSEVQERCMEPFFSTKPRGISTGLGLVLVYGLVREASGTVELRSALGKGTTFVLDLPVASPATKVKEEGRGKSAVVALHDARLRSFVTGELTALSYDVKDSSGLDVAELCVVDCENILRRVPKGAKVVYLGSHVHESSLQIRSLGGRPHVSAVRAAIRDLCGESDA